MCEEFDNYADARDYLEYSGGVLLDWGFDKNGIHWFWVGPYAMAVEMYEKEYIDSLAPSYDECA